MLFLRVGAGLALLGLGAGACAQSKLDDPIVNGYVTAVNADGSFAVMGMPIRITPKTTIMVLVNKTTTVVDKVDAPYLGELISVWGKFDKKLKVVAAEYVHVEPPEPAKIAGKAMIDKALDEGAAAGDAERLVRADGFALKLTTATKMHYNEPLASLKDVGTNQWITYTGVQGVDGVVAVNEAEVWNNRVDPNEVELRKKKEFDPAAVTKEKKQGAVSRETFGIDARKLPAHQDEDLQARIDRIGRSLVPAYQKALADTDPTKINFRFQVVDSDKLQDGWGLSSGIVQVPYTAVVRMTSDAELASVLADHVAMVIEKQALMNAEANFRLKTANWVGAAGSVVAGAFVPGLGLATGLLTSAVTGGVSGHIVSLAEQQSSRVSLCLMHDAGYSLASAPVAYWLIAPKKPKPVEEVVIPERAIYLYGVLGVAWRGRLE